MKTMLVVATTVVLAGCTPTKWVNKNPQANYELDKKACEYEATKAVGSPSDLYAPPGTASRYVDIVWKCMQMKDWENVPAK